MKWTKLGLIFQPTQHQLPNGCREFSQSPQALVLDDRVRIYFSTRASDAEGMFLSHIAFVDFDLKLRDIIGVATDPVIRLGALGTFDEHGIFPMNAVKCGSRRVMAYTCGWSRRISVPVETSIGLAVSNDDGLTFQRAGDGPILTSSLNEPFLVGDPFVTVCGGDWHMWYIFGTHWIDKSPLENAPARVYKIGHATSVDGTNWMRTGRKIIIDSLNADECQALPTVIEVDGRFHMYFCYREATDFRKTKGRGYRLGYANSDDLENWTRDDDAAGIGLSSEGWDSEMMCYPHLFRCNGEVYLLYNGNEFGRDGFGIARLEQ